MIDRGLLFACVSVCLGSLAAAAEPAPERIVQPLPPLGRAGVVVPGGYARQAPANTARPIEMAIADGLDWVEVEIRRSKDGRHVVFDADSLDGRTSGTGPVKDRSLAELTALDAGSWFAPRFADARMMSLADCLAVVKGKIGLVVVCRDVDPEALVRDLRQADLGRRVLVAASDDLLGRLREFSAGRIPLLARALPGTKIKPWVAELRPAAVAIAAADLSAETCRTFHELGVSVMADATAEDKADRWDRAVAAGADLLRTGVPEEFVVRAIAERIARRPVLYAAHRGASRYAPENTVASLDKAVRLRADYVEIDVHTSADGGFFLMHDRMLDRTTTGRGPLRQASGETIGSLDAGAWFGRPYAGARVPELDEYLAHFPPQMQLYFDAKDIAPEALAAAVARHGLVERTIVYQSPVYLEKLREINPRIRALPPASAVSHVDTLAKRIAPHAVDARWTLVTKSFIEHSHGLGVKVFADAPSGLDVDGYRRAIGWGIDLIQTDHPLRLWRAIELGPLE